MGLNMVFDRARSSDVDSGAMQKPLGLGLPGRRSKTFRRKRQRLRTGRLSLLRVEARETELPKARSGGLFFDPYAQHKYFLQRRYHADVGSNRRLTS